MIPVMYRLVLVLLLLVPVSGLCSRSITAALALLDAGKTGEGRAMLLALSREARDPGIRGAALFHLAENAPSLSERVRLLQELLRQFPGSPYESAARQLLAAALADLGRRQEALAVLQPGLAGDREGDLRFLHARLLIKESRYAQALESLRHLAALGDKFDDQSGVAYCRGYALFHLQQLPAARQAFEDFLKRFQGSSWEASAVFHVAEIHYLRKEYGEARRWYERVIREFPNSLSAFPARGRLILLYGIQPVVKPQAVYEIQLAAYTESDPANRYLAVLQTQSLRPFLYEYMQEGKKWYSVRIGYYRTRKDAEEALRKLAARRIQGFIRSRTVSLPEDYFGK